MKTTSRIILYWIVQQMPVFVLAPALFWTHPSAHLSYGWMLAGALIITLVGVLAATLFTRAKARKGEMEWQQLVLDEDGRYHRKATTAMLMSAGICVAGLFLIYIFLL